MGTSVAARTRTKPASETAKPSPKASPSNSGMPTAHAVTALETATAAMPASVAVTAWMKASHAAAASSVRGRAPPAMSRATSRVRDFDVMTTLTAAPMAHRRTGPPIMRMAAVQSRPVKVMPCCPE